MRNDQWHLQIIARDMRVREQEERKRAKEERQRLGLPEPPEPSPARRFLEGVIALLIIGAILSGVVFGAVVLIRYGHARGWWW